MIKLLRMINNKKSVIDTVFLGSLLAFFVIQLPEAIVFSYVIGLLYFLMNGLNSAIPRRYFNVYSCFSLFLFPAALTFNHGFTPLFYLMLSPFLLYMAYEFSVNSLDHVQGVLGNIYWLFVFFIVFQLVRHWGEPEPLGAVLPWASTNGIPSYLIVIQIAYSIAYYFKNNRLPLLSSAVTLCVSVFGLGRGSMVVSALIVLLSFLFNLCAIKSSSDRSISLKLFLLIIIPFFIVFDDILKLMNNEIQILFEGSKFASGILDEHRGRIIIDYLNKIDAIGLLLGQGYDNTSINNFYGGNPHNSFIRVHSFYGLVGLMSLFVPVFWVFFARKNQLQKWVTLSFIMLALMRAVSEPIFFPSTLDFFYFLYFFIFFRFAKHKNFKG